MKRRILLVCALLLATVVQAHAAGAASALYLVGSTSVPSGTMSQSTPGGGALPNYDPDRDSAPGLLLQKTSGGASESDPVKYQQWEFDASNTTVSTSNLSIWVAAKDFAEDKTVRFAAYLLDCGSSCTVLAAANESVSNASSWTETTMSMVVDHTFGSGRRLVVKVVVLDNSDDDAWFAYGTGTYDAHLALSLATSTTTTLASTSSTTVQGGATTTAPPGGTTQSGSGGIPSPSTSTPGAGDSVGLPRSSDGSDPPDPSVPAEGEVTGTTSPGRPLDSPGTQGAGTITVATAADRALVPAAAGFVDFTSDEDPDWAGASLFDGKEGKSIGPEEGLMVVFATAAESIEIYWKAALSLGIITALLLWAGLNREVEAS